VQCSRRPGVTDVDEGIVIATSYLMGWRDVPLRALLEARLVFRQLSKTM